MTSWRTDDRTSRLSLDRVPAGGCWRGADRCWYAQAVRPGAKLLGPFLDEPEARAALLNDLGVRQ